MVIIPPVLFERIAESVPRNTEDVPVAHGGPKPF